LVQLIWNAENRLSEVRDSSGTTLASYSYDHLGRRIAKTSGGVTTYYVYDGWNPIAEYTGTTLSKAYTWGMDLIGSMQAAGGVGGLLAVTDGIASYYPTYDGNGNISEYLDSGGTTQAHYEYDAFGNETVKSGAKANDFAHRFSTKPQDTNTGLYYYGYRYYDPVTGRWPSRDPIKEEGGLNLYGYVENNPMNARDLDGLQPCAELMNSIAGRSRERYAQWTKNTKQVGYLVRRPIESGWAIAAIPGLFLYGGHTYILLNDGSFYDFGGNGPPGDELGWFLRTKTPIRIPKDMKLDDYKKFLDSLFKYFDERVIDGKPGYNNVKSNCHSFTNTALKKGPGKIFRP
jgi:RHS repeat-associated protein